MGLGMGGLRWSFIKGRGGEREMGEGIRKKRGVGESEEEKDLRMS